MRLVRHTLRQLVQRVGYDVQPLATSLELRRVARLLDHCGVETVIDVGANEGQFVKDLRRLGFRGRAISFEPLSAEFTRLQRTAKADTLWECRRCALGAFEGVIEVNIAGNRGASSSVLPMLDRHLEAAPNSGYVGRESSRQSTLDAQLKDLVDCRFFIKLDVQGYETAVLAGGDRTFSSPGFVGLQIELSLVELYEGGMLWTEGLTWARDHALQLVGVLPGFTAASGQMLQFDAIFAHANFLSDHDR